MVHCGEGDELSAGLQMCAWNGEGPTAAKAVAEKARTIAAKNFMLTGVVWCLGEEGSIEITKKDLV